MSDGHRGAHSPCHPCSLEGHPSSKPRVLRGCAETTRGRGPGRSGRQGVCCADLVWCVPPGAPAACPGGAEWHGGEPAAPHCPGGLPKPASGENRLLEPSVWLEGRREQPEAVGGGRWRSEEQGWGGGWSGGGRWSSRGRGGRGGLCAAAVGQSRLPGVLRPSLCFPVSLPASGPGLRTTCRPSQASATTASRASSTWPCSPSPQPSCSAPSSAASRTPGSRRGEGRREVLEPAPGHTAHKGCAVWTPHVLVQRQGQSPPHLLSLCGDCEAGGPETGTLASQAGSKQGEPGPLPPGAGSAPTPLYVQLAGLRSARPSPHPWVQVCRAVEGRAADQGTWSFCRECPWPWPPWLPQLGDQGGSRLPWAALTFSLKRGSWWPLPQSPQPVPGPLAWAPVVHPLGHLGCGCFLVAQLGCRVTQLPSLPSVWISAPLFFVGWRWWWWWWQ